MNPEFFGWLSIEGTGIDYPIMYSPDRPEYYINHAFDGSSSSSGVPFVDGNCSADGNHFLIYGHHMKNKTMFGQLPKYADQSYYEEHSVISFDTLCEQREYRVVAAFYSRVYGKKETGVFRYYEYTDLSDEETFNEYMEQIYAAAIYDTGIEVTYGEEQLVLSTCNYHTDNGRFVVVAKRVS
jgi:sortase B